MATGWHGDFEIGANGGMDGWGKLLMGMAGVVLQILVTGAYVGWCELGIFLEGLEWPKFLFFYCFAGCGRLMEVGC